MMEALGPRSEDLVLVSSGQVGHIASGERAASTEPFAGPRSEPGRGFGRADRRSGSGGRPLSQGSLRFRAGQVSLVLALRVLEGGQEGFSLLGR